MLLISSDPVISSKRKLPVKKMNSLSGEVLSLLKTPEVDWISDDSDGD